MDLHTRFWSKVDKSRGEHGCWLWTAKGKGQRYGGFWMNGATRLAHRVAYELTNGSIDGDVVMHTCDTPLCVNPKHLRVGTVSDNTRDKFAKGRGAQHYQSSSEGERFGRWTVLTFVDFHHRNGERWRARCECGKIKAVWLANLRAGRSKSCGCYRTEHARDACVQLGRPDQRPRRRAA